ncbi:hypothetical protein ACLB2K_044487 [Fragaria x ananassa]
MEDIVVGMSVEDMVDMRLSLERRSGVIFWSWIQIIAVITDYVLLANMYASVGEWNEAMRARRSMQDRGVEKPEPGNSMIFFRLPGNSMIGADLHMRLKGDTTEAYSGHINASVH